MKDLRITCECGRNLADASTPGDADRNRLINLRIWPRPGVEGYSWSPETGEEELRPPPIDTSETYTFHCKCRRTHRVRLERIAERYLELADRPQRVVRVVVGIDL